MTRDRARASTSTPSSRSTSTPTPRSRRTGHRLAGRRAAWPRPSKYFKVESDRTPDAGGDRRLLPRAQDGGRGVHRRRRVGHRARAASRTRRSPRRAAANPDVLIPFASRSTPARASAGGARRPGGWSRSTASGASSSTPACRASSPTTARVYPLYEVDRGARRAALFHTGQTGIGAGLPGGGGIRLQVLQPDAASTTSPPTSRT